MSEQETQQPFPGFNDEHKPFASSEYNRLFEDQTKLIDCAKEVVFTVTANVLSQNEQGEYIGSNEICKKNYHIPVPPEKDYHVFMDSFFQFLEGCLSSSAKQAYQKENNTPNE